jgi:hypothetical protein
VEKLFRSEFTESISLAAKALNPGQEGNSETGSFPLPDRRKIIAFNSDADHKKKVT